MGLLMFGEKIKEDIYIFFVAFLSERANLTRLESFYSQELTQ